MAKGRQVANYQHLLAHVTTLSAPARCLSGNALREWPIECLVPSMTATPSCGNELKRVQILLEAFATEREAIAIEQNPDQIDEIRTASDRDLAISKIDRQSKELRSVRGALRRIHDGRFGICEECEEDTAPETALGIAFHRVSGSRRSQPYDWQPS
jgi:hypothetical protein